jgi:hypothetical protein
MDAQLDNLRAAYKVLEDRVIRALRTQLGDSVRLGEQRSQVLQFLQSASMVTKSTLPHSCSTYNILPTAPTYF